MTDAPIYARFILIDSGMRITPCILCSPNRRRLCIIIILDLALATPRVLPVALSTQEFITHRYTWWLVQLYFLVFIGFIVLYFSIICFVNSSVIQPFCILLQWVLINILYYYYYNGLSVLLTSRKKGKIMLPMCLLSAFRPALLTARLLKTERSITLSHCWLRNSSCWL